MNVQENCTIHMFPGKSAILRVAAHIGHGAIIHGAEIGANAMIGMNSVVMDNAIIGPESIVGAMSFVREGSQFEARSLIVGNPAKVIKDVSDEMISWKTKGTKLYQTLPADCHESLRVAMPLAEVPQDRPSQETLFENWTRIKQEK